MKVGILAYHNALNYGAVLQIAALQKEINKLGHDCKIINYYEKGTLRWDTFQKVEFNKYILRTLKWNTYLLYMRKRKRREFDLYLSSLDITQRVRRENIKAISSLFDMFVVGSDQVWNCFSNGSDGTYFLDFVADEKKKNSYAASFGYYPVPKEYYDFTVKKLSGFNNISVRETTGSEIIRSIMKRDVPVVLDPVFFMKPADWKLDKKRIVDEKYIYIYQPEKTLTLMKIAQKIRKNHKGWKIVVTSRTWDGNFGFGVIRKPSVGPLDFLRLIRDAEIVMTNSFHGTALSVIFNKQFLTEYNQMTSSRMDSILEMVGLSDRRIKNGDDWDKALIDYKNINNHISKKIEESEHYLSMVLCDRNQENSDDNNKDSV